MLSTLIQWSLSQRLLVLLLSILLLGFGGRALLNIPIDAFPDISPTQVKIIIKAPGMTPEEVESLITQPVEVELLGIPYQTMLRSISKYALTSITLDFEDGTDIYWARQQVTERLSNVWDNLPGGISGGLAPMSTPLGDMFMFTIDNSSMTLEEKRFLLDLEVRRGKTVVGEGSALNDIVLLSGDSVHMIDFELMIDGHFVYGQRSDGLIISTPTGSTAYALSGGGPIMHPKLDAMVLVPLNPHTLTSRPLVVAGDSEIKIHITTEKVRPLVSCDGTEGIRLQVDDVIAIRKKPHRLHLIHPPGHDFYQACRSKLGWSSRPGDNS